MKRYKVLIIGAGHAGTNLHYPAYEVLDNVEVSGFCDVDEKTVKGVCEKLHVDGCYTDIRRAMDVIGPDIISVTTPPKTHFHVVNEILKSGALVVVEKPIFDSVDEALKIQLAVQQAGGKLVPVHNKRGFRGIKEAVDFYRRGMLGEIVHVNCYWMTNGNSNHMTANPDHWSHDLTGGRWEELIPHPIYIAYQFVGRMELLDIYLQRSSKCLPWMPGDEVLIVLKANKGFVNIRLSSNTRTYNYFEILGTENAMRMTEKSAVFASGIQQDNNRIGKVLAGSMRSLARKTIKPLLPQKSVPKKNGGIHASYIREIVNALDTGGEMPVSWDEALNTLELTKAIGEGIARQWVKTRE